MLFCYFLQFFVIFLIILCVALSRSSFMREGQGGTSPTPAPTTAARHTSGLWLASSPTLPQNLPAHSSKIALLITYLTTILGKSQAVVPIRTLDLPCFCPDWFTKHLDLYKIQCDRLAKSAQFRKSRYSFRPYIFICLLQETQSLNC